MTQLTDFSNRQLTQVRNGQLVGYMSKTELESQLHDLGAVAYDLWLPETHVLPLVIHPNEQIKGIVYGKYTQTNGAQVGRGALVATDRRVILLDKKPLFVRCDEITYYAISAVTYTKVGFAGTVTLHTRLGDIRIRTFNHKCAYHFVEAVEAGIFKESAYAPQT